MNKSGEGQGDVGRSAKPADRGERIIGEALQTPTGSPFYTRFPQRMPVCADGLSALTKYVPVLGTCFLL